jgi:hypothetical protein
VGGTGAFTDATGQALNGFAGLAGQVYPSVNPFSTLFGRHHGGICRSLDFVQDGFNLGSGLFGLLGQVAYLYRNHGKTLAMLTGPAASTEH